MKLYHGSPKKLETIKPHLAKGMTKLEDQNAIFLCKTFHHAALYAIGKSLKEKTAFAVTPKRLIIVGRKKPKSGYVYEVEVRARKVRMQQYFYKKEIKDFKTKKVFPKDYIKNTRYVKDMDELRRCLR